MQIIEEVFQENARRYGHLFRQAPAQFYRFLQIGIADYRGRTPSRYALENALQVWFKIAGENTPGDGTIFVDTSSYAAYIPQCAQELLELLPPRREEQSEGQLEVAERRKNFFKPILEQKGLSRNRWAKLARVDPHTILNFLRGTNPTPDTLLALARALDMPVEQFPD